MSHYGIAVFANTYHSIAFDELLVPYSEENEEYFTFHPISKEELDENFERFKKQNPIWTKEMYMDTFGYKEHNGELGSWYNDNGFYDYYSLDARPGIEDSLIPDGQETDNPEYRYRKSQIKVLNDTDIPIAFVTPDGKWHAAGRVGWFATCDDTPESWAKHIKEFKEFLEKPGDEYVSFVDCHI